MKRPQTKRSRTTRVAALLLLSMLAACAKGTSSTQASSGPSAAAQATASAVSEDGATANDGGKLYAQNCASCHQPNGQGVQAAFPPLRGNPLVTGDPSVVIHVVKYGLSGKSNVEGAEYNGMMPAWGQSLSNADIASVVTYIRSAWNNKASAVTQAEVTAISQ